jgi:hypothetical protein
MARPGDPRTCKKGHHWYAYMDGPSCPICRKALWDAEEKIREVERKKREAMAEGAKPLMDALRRVR